MTTSSRVGLASDQRHREAMEDRAVAAEVAGGHLLVAVFDGHGGAFVADQAAARACGVVEAALARGAGDEAWPAIFAELDADAPACGSTATMVLIARDRLTAAWVGDSRAVLVTAGGCRVLTPDHRIGRLDERWRVVAAGAEIDPPYVMDPHSGQGLMVTRTLGDRGLRQVGIVPVPEVVELDLAGDELVVVIASDGLWDCVDDEEAAELVRGVPPAVAAARLVEQVVDRGGRDNVTVVVAGLGRSPGPPFRGGAVSC
jgi:serine/threonine protein phosphatase PrpC